MKKKMEIPGVALIVLATLCWSFNGLLGKYTSWNALSMAGFRSVAGALILGAARKSFRIKINKPILIGALGVCTTSLLYMLAVKMTSAANAIVLQYAMPLIVIAYQVLFLKQRPRRLDYAVSGVTLLGIVLCFWQGMQSDGLLGDLFALLSAVTWAMVFLAARMPGCDALSYTYLGNLMSCVLLVFMPFDPAVSFASPIPWLTTALMGVLLGLGYLAFSLGMKKGVSSVTAAIVANVEPVLNPTWCFLFLGENPGTLSIVGALIVLIAVTAYSILGSRRAQ